MCLIFSIPTGTVFNNISLECAMAHFKVFYFNCAVGVHYYNSFSTCVLLGGSSSYCYSSWKLPLSWAWLFFFYCMSIARHSPVKHNGKSREQHENLWCISFAVVPHHFPIPLFFSWLLLSTVLPRFTRCCRISGFQIIAILSEMYIIVMEFILDFFLCFTTGNWQMVGRRQPNELPVHGEYHCQRLHLVPLPILLFILFTFCSARW